MINQLLSHVAMTVPRAEFTDDYVEQLTSFYLAVLNWKVVRRFTIEGERTTLSVPGNNQYINIRASDEAMTTSGYEHIGVYVEDKQSVTDIYNRVLENAKEPTRLEIDNVKTLYDGTLTTFKFRYLLPLSIELQHLSSSS